jgi:hypothetical protein
MTDTDAGADRVDRALLADESGEVRQFCSSAEGEIVATAIPRAAAWGSTRADRSTRGGRRSSLTASGLLLTAA